VESNRLGMDERGLPVVEGRYDLVPIPYAKLGPRKLDVGSTYNTEHYRPSYANKLGLSIFLNRAS
jgi:ATP-dependent phosphofructokinase / diphosphate-dependent phosphofructokinase